MFRQIIIFIFITFIFSTVHAKNLEIVCEDDWRPYIYFENKVPKGYSYEILEKVFNQMGVNFSIKPYRWKRALKNVMKAKADALFNASRKPDREAACFYPSEDLLKSAYVFYILKENSDKLKFDSFDDLFMPIFLIIQAHNI
ncbi:transporter substrate-binding domain-containing protein [Desulfobacterales bacterium HSG17]|nr:transporter substrate-binding domain-containing protein [Desulfobacterales bacterium HSG17]